MQDISDYRPNETVLSRLRQVTLVAVVGPTGVGKTTLMRAAAQQFPKLQFVIADVSRPPRPEEKPGVDYHFRSRDEMLTRAERCEYINVIPNTTGDLYATDPASFPAEGLGMMAILADAMPYFYSLPFKEIRTIFVMPPSSTEWQKRLADHHFTSAQLGKRLTEAQHSLEFCLERQLPIVINDQLEPAVAEFLRLCKGSAPATNQTVARQIVSGILAELGSQFATIKK